MRFYPLAPSVAIAAVLAGCAGSSTGPNSSLPNAIAGAHAHGIGATGFQGFPVSALLPKIFAHHRGLFGKPATPEAIRGIYVAAFGSTVVWGFPKNNSGNGPATCTVASTDSVNDIGVDNSGALIVPDGFAGIGVYSNSNMCGSLLGTITDPFGEAADASSIDAVTGTVVVGNQFGNAGGPGSVSVCTLSSGTCSTNLTNPNLVEVVGVALAPNGDCWGDGVSSAFTGTLVYYQGCTGPGVVATGFTNPFIGGLDIDNKGNLVTISAVGPSFTPPGEVNVYSGCNPACTLLSSSSLAGLSFFGHLGRQNLRFVTTDLVTVPPSVEVYSYSAATGVSLLYSFTGGLPCATFECEGAAYSPSSNK